MTFDSLPLADTIQRSLQRLSLVHPTPIQHEAIPPALDGRDILASAQTGSGKTAAFVLPILQRLATVPGKTGPGAMRVLVLVPTRELALQVADVFSKCGNGLSINVHLIYGGVGQNPQIAALAKGPEVIVATPGRLVDLYQQGKVNFNKVEMLVLDEVDRMLDMGFIRDVSKIISLTPSDRQTFCFSATITRELEPIVDKFLNNPVRIMLQSGSGTAEQVDHRLCYTLQANKFALLQHLLSHERDLQSSKTLIFTGTKHGANRLVQRLSKAGLRADAMHGNKSQNAREQALNRFRNQSDAILVATDVAARGIDVKEIGLVINYDLPKEGDSYVHRVGRTARAGATGRALSFVSEHDTTQLRSIERFIRKPIPVMDDHPFHMSEQVIPANEKPRSKVQPSQNSRRSRPNRDPRPNVNPRSTRSQIAQRPKRSRQHVEPTVSANAWELEARSESRSAPKSRTQNSWKPKNKAPKATAPQEGFFQRFRKKWSS